MTNKLIYRVLKKFKFRQRHGTSLVGLLIGVALSIFLITVLLQVFVSNKVNTTVLQDLGEINAAIRVATHRLTTVGAYAGYINSPNNSTIAGVFGTTCCGGAAGCTSCAVWPGGSAVPADGLRDNVTFSFQSNGSFIDCAGTLIAAGTRRNIRFNVVTTGTAGNNTLQCNTVDDNGNVITTPSDIITDLVDSMWIKYGYDLTAIGSPQFYANYAVDNANNYATSTIMTNASSIRTVRIALLLHSREHIFVNNRTQNFLLWGNILTRDSRHLYRLHVFTVPLSQVP